MKMKTNHIFSVCFFLIIFLQLPTSYANPKTITIAGAGPSAKIVSIFFDAFQAHNQQYLNINFVTPERSIKHAGGIRWSEKHLFGRTGRELNQTEKDTQKKEILLAKIPAVFVKGKKNAIKSLSIGDLKAIYTGKIQNWKEVGGADAGIDLVGREPKEAIYSKLKQLYPFMEQSKFWFTFTRDHQVIGHMASGRSEFSLAFGAGPNFEKNAILKIEGEQTGVSVGLVYDIKNNNSRLLKDVNTFARSNIWKNIVVSHSYIPID